MSRTVVIDIRSNGRTGIARYGAGLVRTSWAELAELDAEVIVIARQWDRDKIGRPDQPGQIRIVCPPDTDEGTFVRRSPWARELIAAVQPALYYSTNYLAEPDLDCALVFTMHDLTRFLVVDSSSDAEFVARYGAPELALMARQYGLSGPDIFRQHFERRTREQARDAVRVATVSHATETLLIQHLGIAPGQISVVPSAVADCFSPRDPNVVAELTRRLGITRPYFICVGQAGNHKRLDWLLRSFRQFLDATRGAAGEETGGPATLVITGGDAEHRPEVRAVLDDARLHRDVCFAGFVSDEELAQLYSGATAFLTGSESEGFNLPPAEAIACGSLAIVTDIPAHREVLGDSAYCYPLGDTRALITLMARALAGELPNTSATFVPPRWPVASAAFLATLRSCR